MKNPRQSRLFDIEELALQLTGLNDLLAGLKTRIDGEAFRAGLDRGVNRL